MMTSVKELARAVAYGTENGHGTLIVPIEILGQMLAERADAEKAIETFNRIVDQVESRCMAADGPVTPTLSEMREDELAKLWRAVQSIGRFVSLT